MVIPSKAERKRPTVEHENAVYIAGSLYAIFFGLLGTLVVWDLPFLGRYAIQCSHNFY